MQIASKFILHTNFFSKLTFNPKLIFFRENCYANDLFDPCLKALVTDDDEKFAKIQDIRYKLQIKIFGNVAPGVQAPKVEEDQSMVHDKIPTKQIDS